MTATSIVSKMNSSFVSPFLTKTQSVIGIVVIVGHREFIALNHPLRTPTLNILTEKSSKPKVVVLVLCSMPSMFERLMIDRFQSNLCVTQLVPVLSRLTSKLDGMMLGAIAMYPTLKRKLTKIRKAIAKIFPYQMQLWTFRLVQMFAHCVSEHATIVLPGFRMFPERVPKLKSSVDLLSFVPGCFFHTKFSTKGGTQKPVTIFGPLNATFLVNITFPIESRADNKNSALGALILCRKSSFNQLDQFTHDDFRTDEHRTPMGQGNYYILEGNGVHSGSLKGTETFLPTKKYHHYI